VQLRRGTGTAASAALVALALAACAARPCSAVPTVLEDQKADSWFQYFYGSDEVAVRSLIQNVTFTMPKSTTLNVQWNNEHVVIPAIDAPPGSQEAIDAITTASRPITGNSAYSEFDKTRNEVTGEVANAHSAVNYYLSMEEDYLGQQVGVRHDKDFEGQLLNLAVGASYGWDAIDPLADDDTNTGASSKRTVHVNAAATRVVSPTVQVRVGAEYNVVEGLQHNPYRNVYAGGTNVPENHPSHRERRDLYVNGSKYFSNRSSLRLNYRLYDDDWGILSHEAGARLDQYVTRGLFASWHYRYYTQTAADFYREEYTSTTGVNGYLSGDYRMSPLSSSLFGFGLDVDLAGLAFENAALSRMGLRFDYERYFNSLNYSANFLTTKLVYRF
jgi:hypothetical protein